MNETQNQDPSNLKRNAAIATAAVATGALLIGANVVGNQTPENNQIVKQEQDVAPEAVNTVAPMEIADQVVLKPAEAVSPAADVSPKEGLTEYVVPTEEVNEPAPNDNGPLIDGGGVNVEVDEGPIDGGGVNVEVDEAPIDGGGVNVDVTETEAPAPTETPAPETTPVTPETQQ